MKEFSVIVPVYNVEKYLKEALDSVVNQTVGFRENIQLIIVNDGSTDKSGEICETYKNAYPDNIVYIDKVNGGVSSARNEGMKYATGKYVNFMDSDDIWDEKAFSEVKDFFEKKGESVDLVATRYFVFYKAGEGNYNHNLDYRFTSNRVIDIHKEWYSVQMAVNCVFIRRESLEGKRFDVRLKISEDSIFVAPIILEKGCYGVVKTAVYYYRKREDGGSAIDSKYKDLSWLFNTCEYSYKALFNYSLTRFGKIIPYAQYQVMRDLIKSMSYHIASIAEEKTVEKFGEYAMNLMKDIDDEIILAMKGVALSPKIFALAHKHGENITNKLFIKNNELYFINNKIDDVKAKSFVRIEAGGIKEGKLWLEGSSLIKALGEKFCIGITGDNGDFVKANNFEITDGNKIGYDGQMLIDRCGFKVEIPIKAGCKYRLVLKYDNEFVELRALIRDKLPFSAARGNSFCAYDKYLLNYHRGVFEVQRNNMFQKGKEMFRRQVARVYENVIQAIRK